MTRDLLIVLLFMMSGAAFMVAVYFGIISQGRNGLGKIMTHKHIAKGLFFGLLASLGLMEVVFLNHQAAWMIIVTCLYYSFREYQFIRHILKQ